MVDPITWGTSATVLQPLWGQWQGIAVVAVFITFLLISIAYMVSSVFSLPDMKRWAKAEFIQSIASLLIIGMLILLIQILVAKGTQIALSISNDSQLAKTLPSGQQGDPFAIANLYINTTLDCSKYYYKWLLRINVLAEIGQTGSIQAAGFEFAPGWSLGGIVSTIQMTASNLVFTMMANYFQRNMLIFIQDVMLTVFLPMGIILRIFPFTRGAGAIMMAVAIGLYIVYPLSYGLMLLFAGQQTTSCAVDKPPDTGPEVTVSSPQGLAEDVYNAELSRTQDENTLSRIANSVSLFIVQAYMYPVIALILTFTFIKALADFLGADVAEIGRGLIKLI